jgi:tricorn protease
VKKVDLGQPPSFFYRPRWSPDGKRIALTDTRLNLWILDLEKPGPAIKADTDAFETPEPVWSPDSRWLAYTKILPSQFAAVFVYSLDTGKATQVTDGMSDARFPAWDRGGEYLYFAASTDLGPTASPGSMAGMNRPVSRAAYAVVLRKDLPSPLAPESDEEKPGEQDEARGRGTRRPRDGEKPGRAPMKPVKVTIDFDRLSQRTLACRCPPTTSGLAPAGRAGLPPPGPHVPARRRRPGGSRRRPVRPREAQDRDDRFRNHRVEPRRGRREAPLQTG